MKPFVDRIADLVQEHQLAYEDTTIVVPSDRMITYLQQAFYKCHNEVVLLPKMQTIDHWVQKLTPNPIIEKSAALFELYRIFEADPIEHEIKTFDAFLSWGQLLLSDFDEIDRYLVDPNQLFKNLRDVREIENWSFNNEQLSPGQLKFMAFWEKLGPYYTAFEQRLETLQLTTKGKAYRSLANSLDRVFEKNKAAQFVFAGFNALSEAELSIMKQLAKMGRGLIIMDSDHYYFDDGFHEAGAFQRVLVDQLGLKSLPFIENNLATKALKVEVIECPQQTGQANVIGSLLADLSENELNESLVLLADEQLLGTLLQHLPKSIGKANITLGLPLRQTSLRLWVDLIFRLQEAFQRRSNSTIYHKDFIQYVHHPFILAIADEQALKKIREIETKIVRQNWHFIDRKEMDLGVRMEQLNALLFESWKGDWKLAMANIQRINRLLDEWLGVEQTLEKAAIRTFSQALVGLENLLQEEHPAMNLSTFKIFFQQHWSTQNLAYFGNPLDGLQIMGLLETRGLDFKRIFVLGLNEGTMPPTNPIQTLIPMDLRRFYHLPTPREKQGLFAHHFYRLLHRAEEMYITFSAANERVGSNEPSRFIQQIELELAVVNPAVKVTKRFYTLGNEERIGAHKVLKTPELIGRIDELLKEGLTFSKIAAFLECPLNFYYRYILKIGEENKVEEEIESSTLGSILHEVLELLFEPYTEKVEENEIQRRARQITVDVLDEMRDRAPLLIDNAFYEHFSKDKTLWQTGTNHITYIMAKEIIQKVLLKEKQTLNDAPQSSLFIQSLEKDLEHTTSFDINGELKTVRFHGIIDRIDQIDGKLRVIDYKSGALDLEKVTVKGKALDEVVETIIKNKRTHQQNSKYALQLMLYCYLYRQHYQRDLDLVGIFSFINISESPFYLELPEDTSIPSIELVEDIIRTILLDLYDTNQAFEHNNKAKYCDYCN
ncbi:MAG: PD-(D/E)XK nuclease family protein [Fluviicola sp.]|nr:PD-(D/E)XK nuclease family protein [Fluviicola sp.]